MARLTVALKQLDGLQAKTGWFETSKDARGVPTATKAAANEFGTDKIPTATKAAAKEFGTDKIPPRPFIRPTVAAKGKIWTGQLRDGSRAVLRGERSAVQVMELVALGAAADVAAAIQALTSPPLSPITIARKGFSKPLVETRQMFRDVTGIVEKAK